MTRKPPAQAQSLAPLEQQALHAGLQHLQQRETPADETAVAGVLAQAAQLKPGQYLHHRNWTFVGAQDGGLWLEEHSGSGLLGHADASLRAVSALFGRLSAEFNARRAQRLEPAAVAPVSSKRNSRVTPKRKSSKSGDRL